MSVFERDHFDRKNQKSPWRENATTILKVGAGFASGGFALFGVANTVSAHSEDVDTTDTTERLYLESGASVWRDMTAQGYTPEEIQQDLEAHGVPQSEWASHSIPAGSIWQVSPEVVSLRQTRVSASAEPVTKTLQKGETVWGEAQEAGVPHSRIPDLVRWLDSPEQNNPPLNSLPVGFSFTIPPTFLVDAPLTPVPLGAPALPTEITVPEGSSIIEELIDEGVPNPVVVAEQILEENEMSDSDARTVEPGTVFSIPEAVVESSATLPVEIAPSEEPNTPLTPVEEVAVEAPQTQAPLPVENLPQAPEVSASPEVAAFNIIMDSIVMNDGILTPEAAAQAYTHISSLPRHPSDDPEFPNPEEFIKMPPATVDMPYVVHPGTCVEELYARPSSILANMTAIAIYEWALMQPQFEHLRGAVYEHGDMVSGDHRRHGSGQASDSRDRMIGTEPLTIPDGFAFNVLSPNFNREFTEFMLVRQLLMHSPDGTLLVDHIEFDDQGFDGELIKSVNATLFNMGRPDSPLWSVKGHSEHIHRYTNLVGYENPDAEAGPNTGSWCGYDQLMLDPLLTEQLMAKRATYPTTVAPPETPPVVAEVEAPVVAVQYWQFAPDYKEIIANSNMSEERKAYFLLIAEEIMRQYSAGAHIPPRATLAMAMWEGGWGEGKGVIEGNNPFSHKAPREWAEAHPDEVVWIVDDEYDADGNEIASPFFKYPSLEHAIAAHIRLIEESKYGQYEDAEKCRMDDKVFLQGLIHELRRDCAIGRMKGEEGVMSYATGDHYVEKLFDMIEGGIIEQIIVMNPNEEQRILTEEWLDYHAS